MESLFSSLFLYVIFILLTLITGIIYWVTGKLQAGAVVALVFSLLGPLMVLLVAAQRDTAGSVYDYLMEEISVGNAWARFVGFIHIYLLGWLLFLAGIMLVKIFYLPVVKERVDKLLSKRSG